MNEDLSCCCAYPSYMFYCFSIAALQTLICSRNLNVIKFSGVEINMHAMLQESDLTRIQKVLALL